MKRNEVLKKFMKDLLKIFVFVLIVSGLILFVVHENVKSIELDKKIANITKDIIKINEDNRKILFQLESIKNPNRINSQAKDILNMQNSDANNFVYLDNQEKEEEKIKLN